LSKPDREAILDRAHPELSVRRQCTLLGLARSGVYRPGKAANDNDLAVMRRLDELFLAYPFLGSRRMAAMLRAEGRPINRKRVQRLMRRMGIAALGPRPRTSKPAPGHKIYPYLLRDLIIDRPNQVWAADITYIPMARGFLYLVAIIDWASRAVLAWRLSNTMDVTFCLDALQEALTRFGRPEIFNTDQGSQFTSTASPAGSRPQRSASPWTGVAAGSTTSSSSGYGARSNMRKSTSKPTLMVARPAPVFLLGSPFTIAGDLTRPSAIGPRWRCGGPASRAR
jgi:Integrase core domain/HTH-like domain